MGILHPEQHWVRSWDLRVGKQGRGEHWMMGYGHPGLTVFMALSPRLAVHPLCLHVCFSPLN